jgi:spore coat polysaccharide biosynthesis protein SpsF
MKKVVIIQARMTSTRLPGKILKEVGGKPMLSQQLKRLRRCELVDEIVIATTVNKSDDAVEELAKSENVGCFRGDEQDVLSRYIGAALQSRADIIIRSTADCPLIDAKVTDKVIRDLIENSDKCDYVSNAEKRTYPRGLDVEAFFADTLFRMNRLGKSDMAREHVTSYLRGERPDLFLVRHICDDIDNSDLRLTVDNAEDLELIHRLYDELDLSNAEVSYREIIKYLRENPELIEINKGLETWNPTEQKH